MRGPCVHPAADLVRLRVGEGADGEQVGRDVRAGTDGHRRPGTRDLALLPELDVAGVLVPDRPGTGGGPHPAVDARHPPGAPRDRLGGGGRRPRAPPSGSPRRAGPGRTADREPSPARSSPGPGPRSSPPACGASPRTSGAARTRHRRRRGPPRCGRGCPRGAAGGASAGPSPPSVRPRGRPWARWRAAAGPAARPGSRGGCAGRESAAGPARAGPGPVVRPARPAPPHQPGCGRAAGPRGGRGSRDHAGERAQHSNRLGRGK